MSRHYSTRDFFRQMPSDLVARHFRGKEECDDVAAAAASKSKPADMLAVWLRLPDKQRNATDAEFRDIYELSNEKGFRAILDEANFHFTHEPEKLLAFTEKLAALGNHFERAMVTYLDHKTFLRGASQFHHADSLSYWRKRKNFPHQPAAVDEESIRELAHQIGRYFHLADGRVLAPTRN